jgi:hypothetical protein
MKQSFKIEVWPAGFCDIYVQGVKVKNAFVSDTEQIAIKLDREVPEDACEKRPHDPRVPLGEKNDDGRFIVPELTTSCESGVVFSDSAEVEVVRNGERTEQQDVECVPEAECDSGGTGINLESVRPEDYGTQRPSRRKRKPASDK